MAKLFAKKPRRTCFLLMPFGGPFDSHYERIYAPAIRKGGLIPRRADDVYRPSVIMDDIWRGIVSARIVIAVMTGRNANVFYELGIAHDRRKPVILVAETLADVPFDLQARRVLTYDRNIPDWGSVLKRKITSSIRETLSTPRKFILPTVETHVSKPKKAEKTPVEDNEIPSEKLIKFKPNPEGLAYDVYAPGFLPMQPMQPYVQNSEAVSANIDSEKQRWSSDYWGISGM